MHTLIASRGAVVATAVGLVLSLSLVACSPTVRGEDPNVVGCSLEQFHGDLVAMFGRPVFRSIQGNLLPFPVPLHLPDGWEIRATDGGQFEVLDRTGTVLVTTGTRVILTAAGRDRPGLGGFAVCSAHPYPTGLDVQDTP